MPTLPSLFRHRSRLPALLLLGFLGACSPAALEEVEAVTQQGSTQAGSDTALPETKPESFPEAELVGDLIADGGRKARVSSLDFSPGGPIPDEELGRYHVLMRASIDGEDMGVMAFAFWPEKAPITVRNFLRLVERGFYDGLTFHRVMRDFMVQGGCALGTGTGQSPLGAIKGEFSDEEQWEHRYGVLSMARGPGPDTGGSQFFLINDYGPGAWSLDGEYASFGRLTQGVATLEALSNVKVIQDARGEPSKPAQRLRIDSARVLHGPAPSGELIERPGVQLDLGGQPERVHVHSMLIGFEGRFSAATRTQQEAGALAAELLQRIQAGEDFDTLAAEFSDDPVQVAASTETGHIGFHILNDGVRDSQGERYAFDMRQAVQAELKAMNAAHQRGEIKLEELRDTSQGLQRKFMQQLRLHMGHQRQMLGPRAVLAEVALDMELHETRLVPYDLARCRDGWYLLRRVE